MVRSQNFSPELLELTEPHLDSDRIAAYSERRLSAQERTDVEAHLARCEECRHEASDIAAVLGRDRRRRRLLVAAPLAAAALVVAVILPSLPVDDISGLGALRSGSDRDREGMPKVETIAPLPTAEVGPGPVRFVWRPVAADALYRLVLTDSAGRTVWEAQGADTALALPETISLEPGVPYFWLVDVLLPDSRVATTGPQRFRVVP